MAVYRSPPGTERMKAGRMMVKVQDHPEYGTGWVKRAHLEIWNRTGRRVPAGSVVHHRDGDKLNDAFENLEVMTQADHVRLHDPRRGVPHTAETRAKLSAARLGNTNRAGIPHSKEAKERIARGLRANWSTNADRRASLETRDRNAEGKFK